MTSSNTIIYVVDDDLSVRRALRRLIKSVGLVVETFPSAKAFLEHDRAAASDCLILDLRMPGMNGLELQAYLTASGAEIPIIFMTGYEDARARAQAMEEGAVDFFQKPFDDQLLLDAIDKALG